MCGLFGIIARRGRFTEEQFRTALDTLAHRGPDDAGVARYEATGPWDVWLGHRRLAILDLSSAGHQPMTAATASGLRGAVVFNGEIYNHRELRDQHVKTGAWQFRSKSDTEVLLAGLLTEGADYLRKMNGMLALACHDQRRDVLLLARDRIGKKPLYVYQGDGVVAFASELKPFQALGLPLDVDDESMAYYRWLGYIPATRTVYRQCTKLPAASFAELSLKDTSLGPVVAKQYWDPLGGYARAYTRSYTEAIDEFLALLDDAVKIRLDADVPVGVFLSGGIDSSLVASSIAKVHSGGIAAFTVQFADPVFDESSVARDTAKQLGIELKLLPLSDADFQRQVAKIPTYYDEPFADSSQIPTMAIAERARKEVTVVLTGDGGDEVFLGYPRFAFPEKLRWATKTSRYVPGLTPLAMSFLKSKLGHKVLEKALLTVGGNLVNLEGKLVRLGEILRSHGDEQVYDAIMSIQFRDRRGGVGSGRTLIDLARQWYPDYGWDALAARSGRERFAALDLVTYMRDDVLVKVDRGTMAYALEARAPLLDYRIVEFGTSLPLDFKVREGRQKSLLRDALATRLGGSITKLGKKGFGVPLPEGLPPGSSPGARWSAFIENQWRGHYETRWATGSSAPRQVVEPLFLGL